VRELENLKANFTSLEATRQRHIGSSPHPDRYDPDTWIDEYAFLTRPGQADIQATLFLDYRTNVTSYPLWQKWLREVQRKMLVVWENTILPLAWPGRQPMPTMRREQNPHPGCGTFRTRRSD